MNDIYCPSALKNNMTQEDYNISLFWGEKRK